MRKLWAFEILENFENKRGERETVTGMGRKKEKEKVKKEKKKEKRNDVL